MRGTVINAEGQPRGYQYTIRDENGNEYFAHFGDLRENEAILEQLGKLRDEETIELGNSDRADLQAGDIVEFEPRQHELRAIHVVRAD